MAGVVVTATVVDGVVIDAELLMDDIFKLESIVNKITSFNTTKLH